MIDELAKLKMNSMTWDKLAKLRISSMSWISCTESSMSWLK